MGRVFSDQGNFPPVGVTQGDVWIRQSDNATFVWDGFTWDPIVATSAPSGPAGGDLGGTYPNPTVAKVGGNTPVTNATAAGGDLGGTYPNPSVQKLNGSALTATGYGLTGTHPAEAVSLTTITAALAGNVNLTNTGAFFDGPSVAQATIGTWLVIGSVTVHDTAGAAQFDVQLNDGTTVFASTRINTEAINHIACITLAAIVTSPASNLRLSVKDLTSTSGVIDANVNGQTKNSTISATRIA